MADDAARPDPHAVTDLAGLAALYAAPSALAAAKTLDRLDRWCRRFLELSPFVAMASADADGKADVGPRGDRPGFVRVLDDRTIAIPDRPGNNRIDTLRNIVANPEVATLFMIPGVDETLRINGRARLSRDPALLEAMAVDGKPARLAIVIEVREAFLHCAKAFKRSRLWDPAAQVPKGTLPTIARMIADQKNLGDEMVEAANKRAEIAYREGLW
jgi:PPOX class probable FMN-dependent enzyme